MIRRHNRRAFALRYDDGYRGGISLLFSAPPLVAVLFYIGPEFRLDGAIVAPIFAALCASFTLFFLIYLIWTHRLFSRTDPVEVRRIAALQHGQGASGLSKLIGLKSAEDWAMSAALIALLVSGTAAILGAKNGGLWLPLLVLLTVAAAWVTVAYAFGLRYLRLHASGERIEFDIDEDPTFADFLSMAVMVSAVAATSAGTARTRAGLTTMRTHTYIAFAFNALVVAMAVSLISTLIGQAA